ncbi:type II toxin-antitoxin system Phd/YefM family antitoxin [Pseudobacteriovorax antillogorgiicola]|uniref:Antitoxin n=1 Tax=Pseudobacteriovorax antillogorgiicola TaxID=1513793 RepID=A0A1Y6CMP2_9BACT|nr:type II toxin-antitoxin system Phd/YefM family antitoxin [Pseudobacteriovorax antillogorgiicola]TCS46980.1 prevent-host-death family protein [Pseudobacteriovorax antillogorgiicola]SMF64721.1 prevent-host-death family protein [Pseudobacteriovorax antillogorgiicola]
MSSWSVKDAKNDFSKLIKATNEEPQVITSHGQKVAVVYRYDDRKHEVSFPKKNLEQFLEDTRKHFEESGISGMIKVGGE